MLWAIAESGKLEETNVRHNLVEAREDKGLEGLLLFMYPNFILFSGLLTTWRVAEMFYTEDFGFLFDNTSLCCLCVYISLPLIFAF